MQNAEQKMRINILIALLNIAEVARSRMFELDGQIGSIMRQYFKNRIESEW